METKEELQKKIDLAGKEKKMWLKKATDAINADNFLIGRFYAAKFKYYKQLKRDLEEQLTTLR